MPELDYDAIGMTCGWEERIIALADRQAGRDRCWHTLEEQRNEPCDIPLQRRTAAARRRHRVQEAEHDFCGDPGYKDETGVWRRPRKPGGWLVMWELQRRRPGARAPWDSCDGCILSYLGATCIDASMLDALRGAAPRQ